MAFDFKILVGQNGADFVNLGNDLAITTSVSTMLFLSMFGGNIEASTVQGRRPDDDKSYWANDLEEDPSRYFNSLTERTIRDTALNSAGRTKIENAIKEDVKFLNNYFTITVTVEILSDDLLRIKLFLTQIDTGREEELVINIQRTNGDFSILDFSISDFYI